MQTEFPGDTLGDRLIEAAVDQINDCRLDRLDLDDIARRVGITPAHLKTMYADEQALDEAVGNFGIARLSDSMNREMIAVAPDDHRAALIALGCGYLLWARQNPRLYAVITTQLSQTKQTSSIVHIYDASFVPLVRRFLGETDETATRRATMARAFVYGLTDLVMDSHLELWMPSGATDLDAELRATVAEFVDMLLSFPAKPAT